MWCVEPKFRACRCMLRDHMEAWLPPALLWCDVFCNPMEACLAPALSRAMFFCKPIHGGLFWHPPFPVRSFFQPFGGVHIAALLSCGVFANLWRLVCRLHSLVCDGLRRSMEGCVRRLRSLVKCCCKPTVGACLSFALYFFAFLGAVQKGQNTARLRMVGCHAQVTPITCS